jgi:phosphate-selective porin OprO/OprP
MKKYGWLAFAMLIALSKLNAQEIPLATKAPYFSYKSGLGFSTPDSAYSMNIRFRIQNRFLMNTISDERLDPASWEARVRRCRLSFTGHVYHPHLSYYIQLSFSRGDMDWNDVDASVNNNSPNVLRDAMLFYRPNKHLQIGFGQGKLPGNRQRVISSGQQQFYDRSPVNANYTLDRDFGLFLNYTVEAGGLKTKLKTAVTSGEGRNSVASNSGLAYTGRLEFLPFGDFTDGGDYFEGDVAREEKPKLSLAGGYHFNDLAVRNQGQLGRDLFAARSFSSYLMDLSFKYRGFALSSEYIRRQASTNPITRNPTSGSTRFLIEGDGINTQISYCFKTMWEIAARYSLVTPSKRTQNLSNQNVQYGAGLTRYLMKHKVKAQFNTFYNHDRNLAQTADIQKNFFAVFQVELGI